MQKRNLDTLADKGVWISDDRMYAFVSAAGSITELGFHGNQIVSRNSRLLADDAGIFRISYRTANKKEKALRYKEVEWNAAIAAVSDKTLECSFLLLNNMAHIGFDTATNNQIDLSVRFSLDALYSNAQGERKWSVDVADSLIVLTCTETIWLREWMEREGPYAGDFLIPEHWRRLLFKGGKRSGLATAADIREEFLDADFPIHDSLLQVYIEGEGFHVRRDGNDFVFETRFGKADRANRQITISFADDLGTLPLSQGFPESLALQAGQYADILAASPTVNLKEFKHCAQFFGNVSQLFASCIVSDNGMPRASVGSYYWLWAWDALVSVRACPSLGNLTPLTRTVAFVNAHRDEGGVIPMRWTRALQPLDTPDRGSLEFLLACCVHDVYVQTGDMHWIVEAYPYFVLHFEALRKNSDNRGLFPSRGFYPDLLTAYGRTDETAVCMEVGCFYCFCTLLALFADAMEDAHTKEKAEQQAAIIANAFDEFFWDDSVGFYVDSRNVNTGESNRSYPLFSLLFLQSDFGFDLIHTRISAIASFIASQHLTDSGTALLPQWDEKRHGESALSSWYPHWDLYMLRILRRAKDGESIMKWLRNAETTLEHLGYCPEFLDLTAFSRGDESPYKSHGAANNVNGITAWHLGILEGMFGLHFTADGMEVLPLHLPIETMTLSGVYHLGTIWDVEVSNKMNGQCAIQIDRDKPLSTLVVPRSYFDGGSHKLFILYS